MIASNEFSMGGSEERHSRTITSNEYGWQSPKRDRSDEVIIVSSSPGSLIGGVVLMRARLMVSLITPMVFFFANKLQNCVD